MLAIGFGPIGLYWLFPLYSEKRKLFSGILFLTIGVIGFVSFGVLMAPR
jgi:hypothetical protein